MNEQEPPEKNNQSPYDLWPDEPTPFEPPDKDPFDVPFVPIAYTPETPDESIRKSGLAYSAGIVFFGSVAFMLFLGWLADLLFGSSPWGKVGGIVLGSVIGFLQFFRITSQIFSNNKAEPEHRPLLTRDDEEE